MAERPTFLFIGENVASGVARARALADVTRLPLSRYNEDWLRQLGEARYQWLARHASFGGVDVRPLIFSHNGVERLPSAISAVGGNRSRITATGHGKPDESTVILGGVVVNSGPDPNGLHWADKVDNDTLEIEGNFFGSYSFQSSLVTASGGRTLKIETPDTIGGAGVHRIVASSGDFLADGFRKFQRLAVIGANCGAFNQRLDYFVSEVTATTIVLRDLGSAGFFQEVAAQSSGISIQGTAALFAMGNDVYINPFDPAFGKANGQTEWLFGQGMYPSIQHGIEAAFFPECLDDPSPPADFDVAPLIVQCRSQTEPTGTKMSDGVVRGVQSLTQESGATRLVLTEAHGWSGTERVHVIMGPGLEELTGYHLATIINANTIEIAVEITEPLPDFSKGVYSAQNLGTVAERQLVPLSVTTVGAETEIATTTAHGMSVGDWIVIGELDSTPSIDGAHPVSTVVDSTTFRIGRPITSASNVGDAWITSRRRWSPGYQPSREKPLNGGGMLSYAKQVLESSWRSVIAQGDTTHLAGIICCWGYTADDDSDGNSAGSGNQIDRFWIDYQAIVRDIRAAAMALEASLGMPLAHSAAEDIPVIAVNYSPDQTVDSDPQSAGYLTRTDPSNILLTNLRSIRAQTVRALTAIGGKVGMVDPWQNGWKNLANGIFWAPQTGMEIGRAVYQNWKGAQGDDPPAISLAPAKAPVYFYCGQSQCEGTILQNWLLTEGDPNYNGEWYDPIAGGVIPGQERQAYIWSHFGRQFEEYVPAIIGFPGNSNTHPIVNADSLFTFGPDASLILKLRERHPEGCYLIKLGQGNSSLQVDPSKPNNWDPDSGDLYELLRESWDEAKRWLCDRGLVPDVRGFIFDQGEADTGEGFRDTYQASLTAFIARVREDFGTRVEAGSAKLPFVIGRLMKFDRQFLDPAGVDAVRAAQDAVAAADSDVVSVDLDSCAITTDDTHRSGRGTIRSGLLLGEALESCASYGYAQQENLDLKPGISGVNNSGGESFSLESVP